MINNFERRCWAEIDLDNLRHNYQIIEKAAAGATVMAVVKANAYGHGDLVTSRALAEAGAKRFAVSGLAEAVRLRRSGLEQPILVLGYTSLEHVASLQVHGLEQCIFSPEYAKQLSDAAILAGVRVQVHLKVDTGMGRLGFNAKDDFDQAVKDLFAACSLPGLTPTALFTHFAAADSPNPADTAYTEAQFALFGEVRQALAQRGCTFKAYHCCNSAATIAYPAMHLDIVRPGIALYGCNPSEQVRLPGLKPAFCLKTVVTMVKDIAKGDQVSYGRTFTAQRDMRVATLAVGYADGYPRLLSGAGMVEVGGQSAPILGRVCMDQIVVDVTGNPKVQQGGVATVFGGPQSDTIDDVAQKSGTINYEILCNIGRRVQRVYIEEGRETKLADYMYLEGEG